MELIIRDSGIDSVGNGGNFRKVAYCEALSRRTTDKIVSWMFVGICGLLPAGLHKFPDGINPEALMRVNLLAFAIDNGLGKIFRVDTTGEELGGVVILALVVSD